MGCTVKRNRHGFLALRLYWAGNEAWEGLGLRDTPANRQKAQRVADLIAAEIRAKTFSTDRYRRFFPSGNLTAKLDAALAAAASSPTSPTIGEWYASWITQKQPPLVRPALARDYAQHFRAYLLDARVPYAGRPRRLADLPLTDLRPAHLRDLQRQLLGRGLTIKTTRNIIDGSFRAMVRDARKDDLLANDFFGALDWPRAVAAGKPDPFVELERDQLLEWFRRKRPAYFPFIFTLFHTGARPSELVALRWGDVDVRRGTLTITRSRYLGGEASPKTRGSARTITLLPGVCAVLRELMPLHVDPDGYVFTNARNGGPINASTWPADHWRAALRATGVRPRKFYATRHTFISVALSRGVNLKWLADFCGTSVAMIEKHYGRFLPDGDAAQLRLLAGGPSPTDRPPIAHPFPTPTEGKKPKPQQRFRFDHEKLQAG